MLDKIESKHYYHFYKLIIDYFRQGRLSRDELKEQWRNIQTELKEKEELHNKFHIDKT